MFASLNILRIISVSLQCNSTMHIRVAFSYINRKFDNRYRRHKKWDLIGSEMKRTLIYELMRQVSDLVGLLEVRSPV